MYPGWVRDSEFYNEWMNPEDYAAEAVGPGGGPAALEANMTAPLPPAQVGLPRAGVLWLACCGWRAGLACWAGVRVCCTAQAGSAWSC